MYRADEPDFARINVWLGGEPFPKENGGCDHSSIYLSGLLRLFSKLTFTRIDRVAQGFELAFD